MFTLSDDFDEDKLTVNDDVQEVVQLNGENAKESAIRTPLNHPSAAARFMRCRIVGAIYA